MAEAIERLYKLTVDGTQAARQLGEIARATENLDKRFEATVGAVKKLGAALTAGFTAREIVMGIKSVIDSFDQLGKDAQKIGIAAEDLQRLRYAADLSGVSAEQLNTAITRLSITMGSLDDKGNKAAQALKAIGVNGGDSAVDALKKLSDEFAAMPDGMEKSALAAQVFGKAIGPDMIPLLNAGSEALGELMDEADRFGGVVSSSVLASAEAFNDNLSRMQRTAAGAGAQFTSGLLPALQALSQSLVDSTTKGEGFVSTGNAMGELLVNVTAFAVRAVSVFQILGTAIGATAAALANPLSAGTIFSAMRDDLNGLEDEATATIARLRKSFDDFRNAPAPAPRALGPGGESAAAEAERLAEASKRAAAAATAHAKAEEARWKELIRVTGEQEKANKVVSDRAVVLNDAEKRTLRFMEIEKQLADQSTAWLDNIEDQGQRMQILTEWLERGTAAQQAFARSQLEASATTATTTKTLTKEADELDVLTQGFQGFFDNLADGAADADEIFKRTIQSIIAQLLKLWAQKYIVDAIFGAAGVKAGATGFAFDSSGAIPFARGGVISRPTTFPMALAGEAGPEAILPLRRAADGNLGVQAQASQMNITVNNYADATVTTRQRGPNDLEVLVESTRNAIAADLRAGGNTVSRSFEQAYGIGRGPAASF